MKVGFYGHVRQYHNIKKEIDANIAQVLESGEYVARYVRSCKREGVNVSVAAQQGRRALVSSSRSPSLARKTMCHEPSKHVDDNDAPRGVDRPLGAP